jgi:hypothetical protein
VPIEKIKFILSKEPLGIHEVTSSGWKYKKIESFRDMDIVGTLSLVLQRLLLADAGLLSKLEKFDDEEFTSSSHRKRRYISKYQEALYLQKDESFNKKHSVELYGYWFVTNIGFKELSVIFSMAAKVAGVEYEVKHGLKAVSEL